MRFLQSMLTALVSTPSRITKRGIRELNDVGRDADSALDAVMSANGEVSSLIHAEQLLAHMEAMDEDDLRHLIHHIASLHDIDPAALSEAARQYGTVLEVLCRACT